MTVLNVIGSDGQHYEVRAENGLSVMEAVRALDLGIQGECEGSLACATCHVWVSDDWMTTIGEPSDAEAEMLDCAFLVRATSRLSCQIKVTPKIDGLEITVPQK